MNLLNKIFLLFFLLLFYIVKTYAIDLKEDEAIVLMLIEDKHVPSISQIVFNNYNTNDKIYITCRDRFLSETVLIKSRIKSDCIKSKPKVVKAGKYYLRAIKPVYSDVRSVVSKRPLKDEHLIEIKVGSVTYLGDWLFTESRRSEIGWKLEFDYSLETLAEYRYNYPYLTNYETYLSGSSDKLVRVKWQ